MRRRTVSILTGTFASLLLLMALVTSALAQGGCQSLVTVDTPKPNTTLEGTTTIGGWAIDQAAASGTQTGIGDVVIYRDAPPDAGGVLLGTASKVARPDVNAALGLAAAAQAGWTLNADMTGVSSGPHAIYVYVQTGCGWVAETVPVAVSNPTEVAIDAPTNGQSVLMGQQMDIGGWALDADGPGTGVTQVMVYLDAPGDAGGTLLGAAAYGKPRPDVAAAKGRGDLVNSGYDLIWTVSNVAPGRHAIYVHARSNSGAVATRSVEINVSGTMAPPPPTAYDNTYNQGYYGPGYNQGYSDPGYNQGYYGSNPYDPYSYDYRYTGYDNPYPNAYGNTYGTGGCPSGYVRSGGQCVYVGSGYGYGYGSGYCGAGYVMMGSQCIYTGGTGYGYGSGSCPSGYLWSGSQCVYVGGSAGNCPAGYVLSGQQCVYAGMQVGNCPAGYIFNGTQCIYNGSFGQGGCPAGYIYLNGACYRA